MKKECYFNKGAREFFQAVKMGDIIQILKTLRLNSDLCNDRDKLNRTPIHWACRRGYDQLVQILVDYGADVSVKDSLGKTPVDMAIENEHRDIAKVSLQ